MQRYTIYLFLWNALHVSDGSSAHHQELKKYIYSIGYFGKTLLLPATVVEEMEHFHDSGSIVRLLVNQFSRHSSLLDSLL